MKKIVLTGGGTAGHVTPNIALLPALKEAGYEVSYIGSYDGIEKKLMEDAGVPYYGIATGKLRRYFSLRNFTDPFRVLKGCKQARKIIKEINPDIVFSKGGFVSVPVVLGAKKNKVPCIVHECDMTPGLANKIAIKKATKVCCNFPETADYLPKGKAVVTGTPIREELLKGDAKKALEFCGFKEEKPTLLIVGGSLGSANINTAVRSCLDRITEKFNVVHLTGKGKLDKSLIGHTGYVQYEYIKDELADLFALADVVISRAGANAICELKALKKPTILIPLSKEVSRGDQILNAESFAKRGYSKLLMEEDVNDNSLFNALIEVYENKDKYINAMANSEEADSVKIITDLIIANTK